MAEALEEESESGNLVSGVVPAFTQGTAAFQLAVRL